MTDSHARNHGVGLGKRTRLGAIRHVLEQRLPPRLRLALFRAAATVLPSRVGPGAFLRLADELAASGDHRRALCCWRVIHRMAPMDTRVAMQRVACAADAGAVDEIGHALRMAEAGPGLPPQVLAGLAGELAARGDAAAAARVLHKLARLPGADRLVTQSPSPVPVGLPPGGLAGLARAFESHAPDDAALLRLARLCFAFRNPGPSVKLFARVSEATPLQARDRIAMLHASCCDGSPVDGGQGAGLRALVAEVADDPDALGLLAKVAVVSGEAGFARDVLATAMRLRAPAADAAAVADCLAMLDAVAALRDLPDALPPQLMQRSGERDGVPKVFVSGFGWSGSGALYDDVRGVPGFSEFEGSGRDAIINEDADSEVTFVQGPGGLGDLWASAVTQGRIPWDALWHTLVLHVAGVGAIGYAQYKCAAAARNHLQRYGNHYTRPFLHFVEAYARLRRKPAPGALHGALGEATEALCGMLLRRSGGRAVLFNNAIFGRDAVMFEIFSARRVAVVYRDPRDVYVDRRDKDLNHWRTPGQLAAYYAEGLRRYATYRRGRGAADRGLREVPFERFVVDEGFRSRVRAWLLEGMPDSQGACHFDPDVSRGNIGIYAGVLSETELRRLRDALGESQVLDHMVDAAWGRGAGA